MTRDELVARIADMNRVVHYLLQGGAVRVPREYQGGALEHRTLWASDEDEWLAS